MIRQLEMDQTYEISKEMEELKMKITNTLEEFDDNLISLTPRCRYFEKTRQYWKRNKIKKCNKKKDRLEIELKKVEE